MRLPFHVINTNCCIHSKDASDSDVCETTWLFFIYHASYYWYVLSHVWWWWWWWWSWAKVNLLKIPEVHILINA